MDLEDIIKLVIFAAVFILPPILKAAEKKKNAPQPTNRKAGRSNRPAPRTGQTLSEWIEEVRRVSEGKEVVQSEPKPSPTPTPAQEFVVEEQEVDDSVVPVQAHVSPIHVDIKAHVDPVQSNLKARYTAIQSRFGSGDSGDGEATGAGVEKDSARRARGAKRAKREPKNSSRARRASDQGKARIKIRRRDLKRAIIMREILSAPLALRDDEDGQE